MWDTVPAKLLVGVESADCEALLHYAAAEAVRRGCGIHLVHVASTAMLAPCALDDFALLDDEARSVSEAALAKAANRLREIMGDAEVSVSLELTHGSTVRSLVALSAYASLTVLQHRDARGDQGPGPLGVAERVAAGAHSPVVAVPQGWTAETRHGRVLVGVGDPTRAHDLVRAALEEAARRGARLVMVHAWTPDAACSSRAIAAESDRRHDALSALLGDLLVSEPDHLADHVVRVERAVEIGPAAGTLLRASHRADLVVVGRHHPLGVMPSLGTVTRELLSQAAVPVMVLDPLPRDALPGRPSMATAAIP